jgi:hypothetical protein
MTKKKNTPAREPQSKVRYLPPTSEELALATRSLHESLAGVVASFDRMNALGIGDAEAWERIRFIQPDSKRVNGSKVSGPELAIRAYAERSVLEGKRKSLGRYIGELALALARGERQADDVLREAITIRADGFLEADASLAKLRKAVKSARNETTRWRAAYNILAFDAEAWPLPDTARARRDGGLQELYEWLTGTRAPRATDKPTGASDPELAAKVAQMMRAERKKAARKRD